MMSASCSARVTDFSSIDLQVLETLGWRGGDNIGISELDELLLLISGDGKDGVKIDAATIMKSLHIDNPAAKFLYDKSEIQDVAGLWTTSVVILVGELLRQARGLLAAKLHPMTIMTGFRMAAECACSALLQKVMKYKVAEEKFRSELMAIAMTTMSSQLPSQDKEHLAKLAVDAVVMVKGSKIMEAIRIVQRCGLSLNNSLLEEGFILDEEIDFGPKCIKDAKIWVVRTAVEVSDRWTPGHEARIAAAKIKEKENLLDKMKAMGIDCVVSRRVYDFGLFAKAGKLAIELDDYDGIELLAPAIGAEIVTTLDNLESVKFGSCKLIEEIMIGDTKYIHFSGVKMGPVCTIVLRGYYGVLDDIERSLLDALNVLSKAINDGKVLFEAGCPEMVMPKEVDDELAQETSWEESVAVGNGRVFLESRFPEMVMAKEVGELARKTLGEESLAIKAFSKALVAIPTMITDNARLDIKESVALLCEENAKEVWSAGVDDAVSGSTKYMTELVICEAFKVNQAKLLSATEPANVILRY